MFDSYSKCGQQKRRNHGILWSALARSKHVPDCVVPRMMRAVLCSHNDTRLPSLPTLPSTGHSRVQRTHAECQGAAALCPGGVGAAQTLPQHAVAAAV